MHPKATQFLAELSAIKPMPKRAASFQPQGSNYLIFFTPRAGSSWLTELLKINKKLGDPDEWFNPDLSDRAARSFGTSTVFDYVDEICRFARDPETSVFGAEITYGMLDVFDQMVNLFAFFPPKRSMFFYLRREDIVAQAISLYRMTAGAPAHSHQRGDAVNEKIPYDGGQIARWLEHVRIYETRIVPMLEGYGISPHCLTYEKMMASDPRQVLDFFHQRVLGKPFSGTVQLPQRHSKLKAPETTEWHERFCRERANYLERVHAERPPLVSDI